MIFRSLDNTNYKAGSLRLSAKIHKESFSWRPIINLKDHPTNKICKMLDFLFKPLVYESETYLKDSQNLLQIC